MSKNPDINDFAKRYGLDATRAKIDIERDTYSPGVGQDPQTPLREPADKKPSRTQGTITWRERLIEAPSLCDKRFEPVRYVVPGLFPEGVTLLASRPKLGKSWLLLQICGAVANGTVTLTVSEDGQTPPKGDVLYLALEDGERRLQRRLTKYFGAQRECWPARLTFATRWRRLDQGGLDDIRGWCKSANKPILIAIDTLKKARKPKRQGQSDYDADYEACEGLLTLAHESPGLAFIVAHHDRKMEAEDVFDTISGTLGLTGGVDTVAVMKRRGQSVTLHIEGRDLIDTVEKAVNFDRETCRWTILGEAAEVQRSAERSRVLSVLAKAPEGLPTTEIVSVAGLSNRNAADVLLFRMLEDSEVERIKRGIYGLPGTRARLAPRKTGKKERINQKSSKPQGDSDLTGNLTTPSTQKEMKGTNQKSLKPQGDSDLTGKEIAKSTNLTAKKTGKIDSKKPKLLKPQEDIDSSFNLTAYSKDDRVTAVTRVIPTATDKNPGKATQGASSAPAPPPATTWETKL
jgi:AAA domain